jgi:hypothetical protein
VSGGSKLGIEFEFGTPLYQIVNDVIKKILDKTDGDRVAAAKALQISRATIDNRLGARNPKIQNPKSQIQNHEDPRSENAALAGAGPGASPPSSPGGTELQDSEVRSQEQGSGDRSTDG